jgi:hypothetical protein
METAKFNGGLDYIAELCAKLKPVIVVKDKVLQVVVDIPIDNCFPPKTETVTLMVYTGALNLNEGIIIKNNFPHHLTVKAKDYFFQYLKLKEMEFREFITNK